MKKASLFGQEQIVKILLIIIILIIIIFLIKAMTGQSFDFLRLFGRLGR